MNRPRRPQLALSAVLSAAAAAGAWAQPISTGYLFPIETVANNPYCITQHHDQYGGHSAGHYHSGADVDLDPAPNIRAMGHCVVESTAPETATTGGWGNHIVLRCLTHKGAFYYPQVAHLASMAQTALNRVVPRSVLGVMGGTGAGGAVHLHLQVRSQAAMGAGYTPGPSSALGFVCPFIDTGVASCSGFSQDNTCTGAGFLDGSFGLAVFPYLSTSATTPTSSNYGVYAIANRPLYGALTFDFSGQTHTYQSSGLKWTGPSSTSGFLASLTSAQSNTISGQATLACTSSEGCDHQFFAHFGTVDGAPVNKGGYPLKVAVLPDNGSHIVDNDGRTTNIDGNQSLTTPGYFVTNSRTAGSSGYYISGHLLPGGSNLWARWLPQLGTFKVFVHIPADASATAVTYKIYPKGRNPNGSCSETDATYPCLRTAAISHAVNRDRWVALTTAGGQNTFTFTAGGYVGVAASDSAAGATVGVDAMKFLAAATAPQLTAFAINNGAASTTTRSVTLNLTATGSPTQFLASESSSFSGASWATYSNAPSFTLSSGNGTKTVYVKVRNSLESAVRSDAISLAVPTPPTVSSFAINNGAASTSLRLVTLTNIATGSPTHYMASSSSNFSGAPWLTYSTSPSFTLPAGAGSKTVYFKTKNATGESAVKSDSITLLPTYSSSPSAGSYTTGGNVLKVKVTFSGSQATFTVAKQDGSSFQTGGTMTLRVGQYYGCIANNGAYTWTYSAGGTSTSRTFDLATYFPSGSKDFFAAIGLPPSNCVHDPKPLYYTGKLTVTAN